MAAMHDLSDTASDELESDARWHSRANRHVAALVVTLLLLLAAALVAGWAGIDIGLDRSHAHDGRHVAAQAGAAPDIQVDVRHLLDEAQREGPAAALSVARPAMPAARR